MSSINMNASTGADIKNNKGAKAGGALLGLAAYCGASSAISQPISAIATNKMGKINQSLSADEFKKVESAVGNAIKSSGLEEKGVGILEVGTKNAKNVMQQLVDGMQNSKFSKFLPKSVKQGMASMQINQVVNGSNAFFNPATNKILMPKDNKFALAAFHEMGHAMNKNMGTFSKVLQKSRNLSILAMPILAIALFKDKKAKDEKPKNKLDATGDFVKNNAGKLAFATTVPILLEEGLATIKGNKLASKLLEPALAGKVKKSNALGFATYAALAAATGLGTFAAKAVRDKVVNKKNNKIQIS